MIPNAVKAKFQDLLEDNDQYNEALMRVALETVQYYAGPGVPLEDKDYHLAMSLCCIVKVD